jgi:hypothetical protein
MRLVSYPDWKIVATISGDWSNDSLCSDPNTGNVFVTPESFAQAQEVLEYAHGGTTPIATLRVPSGYTNLFGCSVDPRSGNLAVSATQGGYKNGALLIYQAAQGNPTVYTDKTVREFGAPTYDGSDDIFVQITTRKINFKLAELPAGKKRFIPIHLGQQLALPHLCWDGKYIAAENLIGEHQPDTLSQIQVTGNIGTIVGTEQVYHGGAPPTIAISGNLMFGFDGQIKPRNNHAVAVWSYPTAGEPKSKFYGIAEGRRDYIADLALSVAPSR